MIASTYILLYYLKMISHTPSLLPFTIVRIKKGEYNNPPLFLIHPGGGAIHIYRELVTYLPDEQSVFAIQAQSFDGKSLMPKTIEELAQDYIKDIYKVQFTGPYQIAGTSFG